MPQKYRIEILYPSHGDLILTLITLCLSFESMLKKPKRSSFIQLKRGSSMTFENKLERVQHSVWTFPFKNF